MARREQRKGDAVVAAARDLCHTHSTAPGRLVPSRPSGKEWDASSRVRDCGHHVLSLSSPYHPPWVSAQAQGLLMWEAGGEHSGLKILGLVSAKSRPWNRQAKALVTLPQFP